MTRSGPLLFGVACAGLGAESLILVDVVPGLEPVPAGFPARALWACVGAFVLLAAGAAIASGAHRRLGALSLAFLFGTWAVLLQSPALASRPRSGVLWTTTFETLALCGAAVALAAQDRAARGTNGSGTRMATLGRVLFGITLPVFGALHFVYAAYVATLVPTWIPARLFWAIFTGAAFVTAGVSIATGVKARLAATLLGVMFAAWVVIVHSPRVLRGPRIREEWSSLFIALAMCGGAWIVASGRPSRGPHGL